MATDTKPSKQKTARDRLLSILRAMASTFGKEADEAMLLGYSIGLADLPLAEVEKSVGRAIRESRFMPTVAELRELAGIVRPEARAALAWTVADTAVRRNGAYRTMQFDDPITTATIARLGGWVRFCDVTEDELPFKRKEFEAVYMALLQRGVIDRDTTPLLGIIDKENAQTGYGDKREPVTLVACDLPALPKGTVRRMLPGASGPVRLLGSDIGKIPDDKKQD